MAEWTDQDKGVIGLVLGVFMAFAMIGGMTGVFGDARSAEPDIPLAGVTEADVLPASNGSNVDPLIDEIIAAYVGGEPGAIRPAPRQDGDDLLAGVLEQVTGLVGGTTDEVGSQVEAVVGILQGIPGGGDVADIVRDLSEAGVSVPAPSVPDSPVASPLPVPTPSASPADIEGILGGMLP